MNTITSIIVGIIVVLGVGGIVWWQTQDEAMEPVQTSDTSATVNESSNASNSSSDDDEDEVEFEDGTVQSGTPSGSTGGATSAGITMTVVAQHSSRTDCWSAINGSVYDLTSWIPKHPGGEGAIVQLCGKDGSAKFNGQHGGDSGKAKILTGFKVGVLAQ